MTLLSGVPRIMAAKRDAGATHSSKGMTDAILEWQTTRFLELETHRKGRVVYVRPEQVVEIAFDGIQASSRYPGGMALRFARVRGYRDDKGADDADTIETVRHLYDAQ